MAFRRLRLFISYRRSDAAGSAGRLSDALKRQFARVFIDSEEIPFGADFIRVITEEITAADVVIVVVGPQWLATTNKHGRRLDQENDPVRYEVALALRLDKRIVPVLIDDAPPPQADELPASLAGLARLHMPSLRNASFALDFDLLVDQLLGRRRSPLRTELDHLLRLVGRGGAVAVAPLVALLAALGAWSGAFDWFHIDTRVQRALLARAQPVESGPVLIAAIDADSERRLRRTWADLSQAGAWRRSLASVIDRAASAGASAVVFDLAFDCRRAGDPCEQAPFDAITAAAKRAAQRDPTMRVVFAARGWPLRVTGSTGAPCLNNRGDGALWSVPLAVLRKDAGRTEVVDANTPALSLAALVDAPLRGVDLQRRVLDFDGPPRNPPLGFSAIERRRDAPPPCPQIAQGDLQAVLLLRPAPAGHWRHAARQLSYAALLDGGGLDEAMLVGRIVLVGTTTVADPEVNEDLHPVEERLSQRKVHGVELQADAIATLAAGRVPRLPGVGLQLLVGLLAGIAGAAVALGGQRWPGWLRLAALFVLAAGWVGVCVVLAQGDRLMNPAYDVAALLLTYAALRALQRLARAVLFGSTT
jgi:CHASE2 domain-containing sensor protein